MHPVEHWNSNEPCRPMVTLSTCAALNFAAVWYSNRYLMWNWTDVSRLLIFASFGTQAPRSSFVPCSCRVNPSCVMCGGWPTPREDPQFELPTLERLSRLDLGVHPILSFPDGECWRAQFMQPFPPLHVEGKTNKAWPQRGFSAGSPPDTLL